MASNEFIDYLLELLGSEPGIMARPMFGGFGIYRDGLMFALVADDIVYLKVDDINRPQFEQAGQQAFRYHRQGREYRMSYYTLPAEAFEDETIMQQWADSAYEAALRAARK